MEIIKNRERDEYSFANINLLGYCNADCFFCLGKDIKKELAGHNQVFVPFTKWLHFQRFLFMCQDKKIHYLYITGQNTDSLMYKYLPELIEYLQGKGFSVGVRTNGYLAEHKLDILNQCFASVGYSIHTLNKETSMKIMGRTTLPNWDKLLRETYQPRISIVVNRYNEHEIPEILEFLGQDKYYRIRYIQMRRVSTDTRLKELMPDIEAYERVYQKLTHQKSYNRLFHGAEIYKMYDRDVCFWRTVETKANSLNYFTDGTVSDMYFVVEGYLKYKAEL